MNAPPNEFVAYHDIGLPGSLPVLNKEAVLLAVKAALVLGCTVNPESSFDRKHYFYKDLPCGYQITQQYRNIVSKYSNSDPLAVNGKVAVDIIDDSARRLDESFVVPITRVQLEQDTAKSLIELQALPHDNQSQLENNMLKNVYLDHNRSGIPLIEIITYPMLRTGHQAATAFAKIAKLLHAAGVSTAELHLGAMRCDVNVSLGLNSPRTEIKNLNSVRAIREACTYEIGHQIRQIQNNVSLEQTTKRWDGEKTVLTRDKAGEKDYRYDARRYQLMKILARCRSSSNSAGLGVYSKGKIIASSNA